jgi:hypothetical protein
MCLSRLIRTPPIAGGNVGVTPASYTNYMSELYDEGEILQLMFCFLIYDLSLEELGIFLTPNFLLNKSSIRISFFQER